MTKELRAYIASAFEADDNLQAIGDGPDGETWIYVLDDAPETVAPYLARSKSVRVVKCSGFGIGPPYWPEDAGALAYKDRMRPVPGGPSVAHKDVTAGTVSGYVVDNLTDALCLLGNHHVLVSPMDGASVGDPILQPGPADGGTNPADLVARLVRWVNIRQENISRFVDCAIARPINEGDIDQNIIALGYPHGVVEPRLGMELVKSGRTTMTTRGRIGVIEADVKVNYGSFSRTIQRCFLTGVPGAGGDSGSMYLDMASHDAVGLLFAGGMAGDVAMTVGCRMDLIEQLLDVTVPPPPELQRLFWLDLSHWQGDISSLDMDMTGQFKANIEGLTAYSFSQMVAAGVDGVVLKAAQGGNSIDPKFTDYYDKARAVGLRVAAYDYVDPDYSAADHLSNFLQAVGDRALSFVAMDCEQSSGQSNQVVTAVIQQFGELLSDHYGKLPWIYTSPYFFNTFVLPWSGWKDYPLWVAFWSETALYPLVPTAWKDVPGQPKMWQFTVSDYGPQYGVGSRQVDLNTMFKSGIALLEGEEPPPPPETVMLTVDIEGQGFVSPGSGQYAKDSTIQLQATPEDNWSFQGWGGDLEGEANPASLLMDSDKDIAAVFIEHEGGPVEFVHYKGKVKAPKGLNIRTGPGTNYRAVGALATGQVVDVLETKKAGLDTWARLGYGEPGVGQYAAMIYGGSELMRFVMVGDPAQLLGRVAAVAGLENAAG